MTVDLTFPDLGAIHGQRAAPGPSLVPLALPQKAVMRGFDLRDDEGRSLPMTTREENGQITSTLLIGQAHQVMREINGRLLGEVVADINDIAGAVHGEDDDASEAEFRQRTQEALSRFREAGSRGDSSDPFSADGQRGLLWLDGGMHGLLRQFADRFVLFAIVADLQPNERRVLKMAYEEEALPPNSKVSHHGRFSRSWNGVTQSVHGARTALGLADLEFEFGVRGVMATESYHVEIQVPDELSIRHAELGLRRTIANPATGTEETVDVPMCIDGHTDHAHLHQRGASKHATVNTTPGAVEVTELGYIRVALTLKPGELLPALILTSVTTGVLLTGCILHLTKHVAAQPDAATALLVVLPAVFAAYLVPGEHRLVRKMFRPLRATVLISALSAFVAAGALVIDLRAHRTFLMWSVVAAVSGIAATILLLATLYAWPRLEGVGRGAALNWVDGLNGLSGASGFYLPPRAFARAPRLEVTGTPGPRLTPSD